MRVVAVPVPPGDLPPDPFGPGEAPIPQMPDPDELPTEPKPIDPSPPTLPEPEPA